MAVNRQLARYLKADGPRGKAGDVIGRLSISEPFPILVSHDDDGPASSLFITAALRKHIKEGWTISITAGGQTQVATVAQNITWTPGGLDEQVNVQLVSPITIPPGGLSSVRAIVTPEPPPGDAETAYQRLSDDESAEIMTKQMMFDRSAEPRFKVDQGALVEKPDARQRMTITGPGGASLVNAETHPTNSIAITFTVLGVDGKPDTSHQNAAWQTELTDGTPINVPIANGVGVYNFPLSTPGKWGLGSSLGYVVAQGFAIVVAQAGR